MKKGGGKEEGETEGERKWWGSGAVEGGGVEKAVGDEV